MTASTVQYVGKAVNLYDYEFKFSGQFDVLKALLRTVYLWDRVRVKGGAYGSTLSFDLYTGDLALVSYRDPNLVETLQVYDDIPEFLNQLEIPDRRSLRRSSSVARVRSILLLLRTAKGLSLKSNTLPA